MFFFFFLLDLWTGEPKSYSPTEKESISQLNGNNLYNIQSWYIIWVTVPVTRVCVLIWRFAGTDTIIWTLAFINNKTWKCRWWWCILYNTFQWNRQTLLIILVYNLRVDVIIIQYLKEMLCGAFNNNCYYSPWRFIEKIYARACFMGCFHVHRVHVK